MKKNIQLNNDSKSVKKEKKYDDETISLSLKEFVSICNECDLELLKDEGNDTDARKLADIFEKNKENQEIEEAVDESGDTIFYRKVRSRIDNKNRYKFLQESDLYAEVDALEPYIYLRKENKKILNQKWHVLIAWLAFCDTVSFDEECNQKNNEFKECWKKGKIDQIIIQRYAIKIQSSKNGKTLISHPYTSKYMCEWVWKAIEGRYAEKDCQMEKLSYRDLQNKMDMKKNDIVLKKIKKAISIFDGTSVNKVSLITLFKIRQQIQDITDEQYSNKYPKTYGYDNGERKEYKEDGNTYIGELINGVDGKLFHITGCKLYMKEKESIELKNIEDFIVKFDPNRFAGNFDSNCFEKKNIECTYLYLNEIDHFFSYYITKYLINAEKPLNDIIGSKLKDLAVKYYMWQDLGIDQSYVIKREKREPQSKHLLKLNRTTKHLEYYRLSTDNAIFHDYYPIRKDFDASDYLMYEKEKEFPCIWGGGDTPTPEGIFQIEKVSEAHEEYVSGYYTGHDKVKFFGYLVVFEDYFIHSNLYTEEATQDTFEQMKPVNGAEEHSSGCIRLTQEDLDWLVKNVEVGTTVVM